MSTWADYFSDLLNQPPPSEAADIPQVNTATPTVEEIKSTVEKQKHDIASGPDRITAENLKADLQISAQMLSV